MKSFGSQKFILCLSRLGLQQQRKIASRHIKFKCPKPHVAGERSFIEVLQGKSGFDPKTQTKMIKNLVKHGFTKEQIEKSLR
ncbi:MAG: hypothetical protein AAB492_00040 [Patescibacteria group bacterium]